MTERERERESESEREKEMVSERGNGGESVFSFFLDVKIRNLLAAAFFSPTLFFYSTPPSLSLPLVLYLFISLLASNVPQAPFSTSKTASASATLSGVLPPLCLTLSGWTTSAARM